MVCSLFCFYELAMRLLTIARIGAYKQNIAIDTRNIGNDSCKTVVNIENIVIVIRNTVHNIRNTECNNRNIVHNIENIAIVIRNIECNI